MSRRRPPAAAPPSAEDAALFREAIGPVRRLEPPPAPPSAPRPAPRARLREEDEAEALRESRRPAPLAAVPGDALDYLKAGLSPRLLRRLRRGHYSVQDEIDLHGMGVATAEASLKAFLRHCRDAEHHCVRIVHGKGRHSGPEGPVLRGLVEAALRRRAEVLAYASAPPAQGGTGATLVLLAPLRAATARS